MTPTPMGQGWREWSLARRLSVLLIGFTLVPVAGLILYDGLVGRRQILDSVTARNAVRAAATADAIEVYLASVLADVRLIAQSPPAVRILIDGGNPTVQQALARWTREAQEIEHYDSLFIADQRGVVVAAGDPRFVGRNYITAAFFQRAVAGQTVADGPRYDRTDGGTYLHFASPVRSPDGVLLGAVVARVTMAPIERIVKADDNFGGTDAFGVLWDDRGIRLCGATRAGPLFGPFAPLPPAVLAQLAAEQRFGPGTAEWLGRAGDERELVRRSALLLYDAERTDPRMVVPSGEGRLQVTIAPLAGRRWLYGIFAPERRILAGTTAAIERLVALGVVLALFIAGAAVLTARLVSQPVRSLVEATRSIAGGDLSRRVRVGQGGELGQLGRSFDTMVDALAGKDAELRRYAENLERMVEERTASLRASEAQLQQAQKMEALGQLAGGVAHDFNNLLTAILGNAHFLKDELAPHPALLHEVEEIERAGERAAALTRQLLTFSRRQVVQPEIIDLGSTIENLRSMLQRLIREDIELVIAAGPGPLTVRIDPSQVEQVIINLAVNARDAMPHGGRLTIEARRTRLDESAPGQRPGEYVVLAVHDTGTGIPPESLPHIFEPFFSTKPKGHGTGLGLATVHGILAQNSGHAEVQTEVGRGTTIYCYLPAVEETAARAAPRPPDSSATPPRARGTETVLLAEDEPALRTLAARMLARSGYEVLVAYDHVDALRKVETHRGPIHLLLTDVVMPGMSGPDLAQRIVGQRPEIRVLFMSGYTDRLPVQPGQMATRIGFMQKPFTIDTLRAKVREVLDEP